MNQQEKSLVEVIYSLFKLLKKKYLYLIIFFIIGGVISLFDFYFTKPYYYTILTGRSDYISNFRLVDYIRILNQQLKDKSIPEFLSIQKEIKEINAYVINNSDSTPIGNVGNTNYFRLQLKVFSPTVVPNIKMALINNLNNQPYIKHNIEKEKNKNENMLSAINKRIEELKKEGSNDTIFYWLNEKKIQAENNLKNTEPFETVIDFYIPTHPVNKNIIKILFLYCSVFLIAGVLFIILQEMFRKIPSVNY